MFAGCLAEALSLLAVLADSGRVASQRLTPIDEERDRPARDGTEDEARREHDRTSARAQQRAHGEPPEAEAAPDEDRDEDLEEEDALHFVSLTSG